MYNFSWIQYYILYTVKRARGQVSFDSLNVKYASKLSCYASPETYLSHITSKITDALFIFLSDKYDSGEASLDSCEAYLPGEVALSCNLSY
jgi:hypothetical protein